MDNFKSTNQQTLFNLEMTCSVTLQLNAMLSFLSERNVNQILLKMEENPRLYNFGLAVQTGMICLLASLIDDQPETCCGLFYVYKHTGEIGLDNTVINEFIKSYGDFIEECRNVRSGAIVHVLHKPNDTRKDAKTIIEKMNQNLYTELLKIGQFCDE
jgi:hypothetical protein